MVVQVRLFAILRERAGAERLELELADGATAADALAALADLDGVGELLDRLPIGIAVNREYATADRPLADGDELALIPPVSGGAGGSDPPGAGAPDRDAAIHARVTEEPLSVERLTRLVGRPGAGAIVSFQGTTRSVERLEYEAYTEMAEERIRAILTDVATRHDLEAAAAEHRVGAVPLGETSVVVAVSAAHRGPAFAAAREVIDAIKGEAPIWKKEVVAADGAGEWAAGSEPPGAPGSIGQA